MNSPNVCLIVHIQTGLLAVSSYLILGQLYYCLRMSCFIVNKLTSVFYASVLLLIINFVITLSK